MASGAGAQDGVGSDLVVLVPADGVAEPALPWRRELEELSLPSLRTRRRTLLAEADSVAQWRRLVRARRELVLAVAVGVTDLGVPLEAASAGGPLDVHAAADLAAHGLTEPGHGLRELVLDRPGGRAWPVGQLEGELRRLEEAQRRLAAYERALRAELAEAGTVLGVRCVAGARG